MSKYRKKPVVVEAMQWTGDNPSEVEAFTDYDGLVRFLPPGSYAGERSTSAHLWVDANRTMLPLEVGEWIIRDSRGFYPCKPDIFEATYEPVGGS